jgi:hypothetical protein
MKVSDKILGALLFCLALFVGGYAELTFPSIPGTNFGPSFFPLIVSIVLGFGGVMLMMRRTQAGESVEQAPETGPGVRQYVVAGFMLFCVLLSVLLLKSVGYVLLLTATTTVLMVMLGSKVWISLLLSAGTVIGSFYLFSRVFGVPLPEGLLAGLF